jgi:endo-1,4-beta-xylanase
VVSPIKGYGLGAACLFLTLGMGLNVYAQEKAGKPKKKPPPFSWVNPLPKLELPGIEHHTFRSPSMGCEVGYCIYVPGAYPQDPKRRFPVVYYLHGGRPGNETKSIRLAPYLHKAHSSGKVEPVIYVFVNGGPVSHYNMPERKHAMGEAVFIEELIPHIDRSWRTVAARSGRGLEGFSQGGRGTARIMFKHADVFCSAAPGGGGYATEKRISEEKGRENPQLIFTPGYNTWDLARVYAKDPRPAMRRLIHVGTKGFNYENNRAYMVFLASLKIPFDRLIVEDAPHSAARIYAKQGSAIMQFHVDSFRESGGLK